MKRSRWIAGLFVAVVVTVGGWAWFSPWGTGESVDSPDGRYTASASNYSRGTWLGGRVNYVEIEIVERSTGNTVWKAERYPRANEVPSDLGDRSKKFIRWTSDSRSVSIPVGGSTDAVWAVP